MRILYFAEGEEIKLTKIGSTESSRLSYRLREISWNFCDKMKLIVTSESLGKFETAIHCVLTPFRVRHRMSGEWYRMSNFQIRRLIRSGNRSERFLNFLEMIQKFTTIEKAKAISEVQWTGDFIENARRLVRGVRKNSFIASEAIR